MYLLRFLGFVNYQECHDNTGGDNFIQPEIANVVCKCYECFAAVGGTQG